MTPDKLQTDLKIARLLYKKAAINKQGEIWKNEYPEDEPFNPLAPAVTVALMEVIDMNVYCRKGMHTAHGFTKDENDELHTTHAETINEAVYNCVARIVEG